MALNIFRASTGHRLEKLAVEFRDTALPPGTHHLSVAITREDQADPRFLAILAYLDELAKRALEEYEARGTPTMGPLG